MKNQIFVVSEAQNEARLDKALAELWHDQSRRKLRELIGNGAVYVNGKRVRVSSRVVKKGDKIQVYSDAQAAPTGEAPTFSRDWIVAEDDDFLVINKPAGLAAQATRTDARNNLLSQAKLQMKLPNLFLVHRLDKHTSGVSVLAKHKKAAAAISTAFQANEIEKTYEALVHGHPEWQKITIESYLGRDQRRRNAYRSVGEVVTRPEEEPASVSEAQATASEPGAAPGEKRVPANAKLAVTLFEVVEVLSVHGMPIARVQVRPLTGRSHQIRVHARDLGHAIVGDRIYEKNSTDFAQRMYLHAQKLQYAENCWQAPTPTEFTLLHRE